MTTTATGRRSDKARGGWELPPIMSAVPKALADSLGVVEGLKARRHEASEVLERLRREDREKQAKHEQAAVVAAREGKPVEAYEPSKALADAEATLAALNAAVAEAQAEYEAVAAEHADEAIGTAEGEVEKALRVAIEKVRESNRAIEDVMRAHGQRRYFSLVRSGLRRPSGSYALPSSVKAPSGDPIPLLTLAQSIEADLTARLAAFSEKE